MLEIETLPPEENMRRDEESLLSFERHPYGGPLFRLYKWSEVCLSLGYSLQEEPSIGIPTVRRPTGGGAFLHGWDISFSLVDLRERWGGTPMKIYRRVSEELRKVFRGFGVEVEMERFRGRYGSNFYCFWVPTLGELTYRGRKVVSMAMRTLRRSFLLHGSVYVDFDYRKAQDILGVPEEVLKGRILSLRELGIGEESFARALWETFNPAYQGISGGRL